MKNIESQYDQESFECTLPHLLSEKETDEHLFI